MTPRFKTHELSKSGTLSIKYDWLKQKIGLVEKTDTVIEFEIPGLDAVLLMRLDPMQPIPERVQRLIDEDHNAFVLAPVEEENKHDSPSETLPAAFDVKTEE